jgi:chromate reductase
MVGLGALLLGGEAYITFKTGLIDEQGNIGDEGTKAFLQRFVDQFSVFVGRLAQGAAAPP